jgi:hypothetical protein
LASTLCLRAVCESAQVPRAPERAEETSSTLSPAALLRVSPHSTEGAEGVDVEEQVADSCSEAGAGAEVEVEAEGCSDGTVAEDGEGCSEYIAELEEGEEEDCSSEDGAELEEEDSCSEVGAEVGAETEEVVMGNILSK